MKIVILNLFLSVLCPVFTSANQSEDRIKSFPSNQEINLLAAQATRAMDQYKSIVEQAQQLLGKDAPDAFQQDRMLLAHWAVTQKALKENPQEFNSPLGFEAVLDLDDASRNAALCAGGATLHALKDVVNRTIEQTTLILNLNQSCTDVSTLLYTVSENAAALYKKHLAWQRESSGRAMDVVQKCTEALKRLASTKKQ